MLDKFKFLYIIVTNELKFKMTNPASSGTKIEDSIEMTTKRFNPEIDLAPIPFNEGICQRVLEMKTCGLIDRTWDVLCGTWMNSLNPPPLFRAEFISF